MQQSIKESIIYIDMATTVCTVAPYRFDWNFPSFTPNVATGYYYNIGISRSLFTITPPFDFRPYEIQDVDLVMPGISEAGNNANSNMSLHRATSAMNINTVTWATMPTVSDGLGSVLVPYNFNGTIRIPLDAIEVQKLLDGTYTNYGLMLRMDREGGGSTINYQLNSTVSTYVYWSHNAQDWLTRDHYSYSISSYSTQNVVNNQFGWNLHPNYSYFDITYRNKGMPAGILGGW